MSFWDRAITPAEPGVPSADRAAYRAERRGTSGSRIYDEPVRQQRRGIYVSAPPKTLADYASTTPRSKHDQRGDESDYAYTQRVGKAMYVLDQQLPADELARVQEQVAAAERRLSSGQTHQQLRVQLESRKTWVGIGVLGAAHDRTQSWGRGFGSGRELEANGHLAASALATPGQKSLSIFDRQPREHVPYYAERTQPLAGSSGEGVFGQ